MKPIWKLAKEPFLLFFIIGSLIYVIYIWAAGYIENNNRQIHVGQTRIGNLEESFQKTWNRFPTESEHKALIDIYIMDEIFFKEAVAMGLDKTDPAKGRGGSNSIPYRTQAGKNSKSELYRTFDFNPGQFRENIRMGD